MKRTRPEDRIPCLVMRCWTPGRPRSIKLGDLVLRVLVCDEHDAMLWRLAQDNKPCETAAT